MNLKYVSALDRRSDISLRMWSRTLASTTDPPSSDPEPPPDEADVAENQAIFAISRCSKLKTFYKLNNRLLNSSKFPTQTKKILHF